MLFRSIFWTCYEQAGCSLTLFAEYSTNRNMFGFNNKYALGNDIFSIDENVVVFPSGNWLTDKIYYNSAKEKYRIIDPKSEISMEYITQYKEYSEKIMNISNNIITYDLIKNVGENKENELIEEVGVEQDAKSKKSK